MRKLFDGVYLLEDRLATKSLAPGRRVYGERLESHGGVEYRLWSPGRSKLAAAILKGLSELPIKPGARVLYLGAASGTTPSHVSDIIGEGGTVFCVERSPVSMLKLLRVCETRVNMVPILADAFHCESYAPLLEKVDVIYQDIAQKAQAEILLRNSKLYLREKGHLMMAVKARAISSAKDPRAVIAEEISKLRPWCRVLEVLDLEPFERDHAMVLAEQGDGL